MHTRLKELEEVLRGLGQATVALSGGVDSGLLAAVAHRALGERAAALTARATVVAGEERLAARALAEHIGILHEELAFDWLSHPELSANGPERCYHCKRALFGELGQRAAELGRAPLLDGSNADDDPANRPGMRALAELGVRSPLRELGFTKTEIRWFARKLGLPGATRASGSCLATRIPTGTAVTESALRRVESAERLLGMLGYRFVRVRCHGSLARLELPRDALGRAVTESERIVTALRRAGFTRVSLDLEGYRGAETCEEPPHEP